MCIAAETPRHQYLQTLSCIMMQGDLGMGSPPSPVVVNSVESGKKHVSKCSLLPR